ncbi:AfsR/SARP family transcriptional regulator [Amycolatopsis minnesotensis]
MTKEIAAVPPESVRFHLLGPIAANKDGDPVDLGAKRERRLLVALLSAAGRRVSRTELVEWVWDDVPADPTRALYEVVSDLRRKCLDALGLELAAKDGWYRLDVLPECVDVNRFRALIARALESADEDRLPLLEEALRLRRGVPLTGLDGRRIEAYRHTLVDDLRTVEVLISQSDIRRGRGEARVPLLKRLVRERPDDSRTVGLLMYVLHRLGSTAEAIAAYHGHRDRLAANGAKVPQSLRELHVRIARGDRDLSPEADVFLGGREIPSPSSAQDDDREPDRSARVVNTIHAPVTGENIVFGIQNQVR